MAELRSILSLGGTDPRRLLVPIPVCLRGGRPRRRSEHPRPKRQCFRERTDNTAGSCARGGANRRRGHIKRFSGSPSVHKRRYTQMVCLLRTQSDIWRAEL